MPENRSGKARISPASEERRGPADPSGALNGLAPALYGRAFWIVFAASFALYADFSMFVLFPLWLVELGAGAGTIGAVVGTGSLAALAARPWLGKLIDRIGRKRTALYFLLLDPLAIALYLPVRALGWHLYVVRAVHGAIEGTARVGLFAMVYDILPEGRRGEGMATFSLCGMVPAAITPLLGEMLIQRWGFEGFFVAAMVLAGTGAVLAIAVREVQPAFAGAETAVAGGASYRALLLSRSLMPLWVVTLMFSLAGSTRFSFIAPYAYQVGIAQVGWYFAFYSVTGATLRIVGGRVIDKMGLERMVVPSLVTLAVGLGLVAWAGNGGMLEVAAVIGGAGHGFLYPSLSAMVISRTEIGAMGRSSSLYTSLFDCGAIAGPYLFGAMAGLWGYAPMFLAAGALLLGGAGYFTAVEPRAFRRRLG